MSGPRPPSSPRNTCRACQRACCVKAVNDAQHAKHPGNTDDTQGQSAPGKQVGGSGEQTSAGDRTTHSLRPCTYLPRRGSSRITSSRCAGFSRSDITCAPSTSLRHNVPVVWPWLCACFCLTINHHCDEWVARYTSRLAADSTSQVSFLLSPLESGWQGEDASVSAACDPLGTKPPASSQG